MPVGSSDYNKVHKKKINDDHDEHQIEKIVRSNDDKMFKFKLCYIKNIQIFTQYLSKKI